MDGFVDALWLQIPDTIPKLSKNDNAKFYIKQTKDKKVITVLALY